MSETQPLIIVSNRGPAQFDRDAEGERTISRGGGGLVTALTGLATHRKVLWVASAMTEEDAVVASEADGPVEIELEGGSYEVDLVASDPGAYELFYSVIANPQLWFVQHYLWDLSNAPGHPGRGEGGLALRLRGRQLRHRQGGAEAARGARASRS